MSNGEPVGTSGAGPAAPPAVAGPSLNMDLFKAEIGREAQGQGSL